MSTMRSIFCNLTKEIADTDEVFTHRKRENVDAAQTKRTIKTFYAWLETSS